LYRLWFIYLFILSLEKFERFAVNPGDDEKAAAKAARTPENLADLLDFHRPLGRKTHH
jgi:hypothetical protein